MRDINRAERLLSQFTSPDSAAGIVGDLSEERGQRGGAWFWRQVLGTMFSLCRGAVLESPGVVLLLVALGLALSVAISAGSVAALYLLDLSSPTTHGWQLFLMSMLVRWPGLMIAGATLVAAAPRHGMAACAVLGGLNTMLSLALAVFAAQAFSLWWLLWVFRQLVTLVPLFLGGAVIGRRWNEWRVRTAG